MARATLRSKGQVTLPSEVRNALHVQDGDDIEFEVLDGGTVCMRGLKMIPAEQAWFWTESWQAGEQEASEDIAAGRVEQFDSGEAFLKSL
jgi:antitoxin PrlF